MPATGANAIHVKARRAHHAVGSMAAIAAHSIRNPRGHAVWSPRHRKYVRPKTDQVREADLDRRSVHRPPISAEFKLVFLSALGATVLCLLLCITLTLAAGREPAPLVTDIVRGLFGLANGGIGALLGLLGAQRLHASQSAAKS